jgi:hypothetical protein
MRLHKFNPKIAKLKLKLRQNKEKYIKVGTLVFSVFILVIGILYFAYAKFSTVNKFKVVQTTVGNFTTGDYTLAAYIDNVKSDTFPAKNTGYSVDKIECNNSATAEWNYAQWGIFVTGTTQTGTKCNVYFVTRTTYVDASGASYPEIYQGLVPVVISDTGGITVADTSTEWYNYTNHNWANAVLVDCSNVTIKNKYFDANMKLNDSVIGQTVDMSEILQMYVWIPRYKYLLWNANNGSSDPQAISITFEAKETAKSAGSTNGTWLTHPAFTFGTTELNGIWVGKFENSGSTTSLKIKPNTISMVNITVGDMFNATRNEELTYATNYGIDANVIDTHMMKNMEWGAVAYLTSSIYGRYTNATTCIASGCEVWINNTYTGTGCGVSGDWSMAACGGTITGCSGSSVSASGANSMSACATGYTWSGTGVNASTTGNQFGIYDMSGGAWEYVMGNMVDSSGNYYSSSANLSQPDTKYYNSYEYSASTYTDHARGKLGDATKETLKIFGSETGGWNSDYAYLLSGVSSWFRRGGYAYDGAGAGVFGFDRRTGEAYSFNSFRSVITAQ